MQLTHQLLNLEERTNEVRAAIKRGDHLGLITSIDGNQLLTLLLSPQSRTVRCYETPLSQPSYRSMTPTLPQAHWFERTVWDMFGIRPENHPRLKRTHLHESYGAMPPPLNQSQTTASDYKYEFLEVEGEGLYEIPVGPIHAGIIEPGHFRFSCFGEVIVNLEIRLGYVHRGIEKNLTGRDWQKTRFLVEAAAGDMPVANAMANASAIEALLEMEVPDRAKKLRMIALEIERVAMHFSDLAGLAGDIGFLAISSSLSRLRGMTLRLADLLGGNRFMKSFVRPGGVGQNLKSPVVKEMLSVLRNLSRESKTVLDFYFDNQVAVDRMESIGTVSHSLAREFGLVGVAARASGIDYDCRSVWHNLDYSTYEFMPVVETGGDVLARASVRVKELAASLALLEVLLSNLAGEEFYITPPTHLPSNATAIGIVESHRGELLHLVLTDKAGNIARYCIKDPSVNNWTGLAIAVRNNLVADFPLCNKSFSLSYSGHDL